MTPADILYGYAFAFRWGGAKPGEHDPAVARATALARERLVGLRVVRVETDTLRFGEIAMKYEVPVVEVYLGGVPADARTFAAMAPPWSTVPWHVLTLVDEAARRGLVAFSAEEARRRRIPWLDLVRDPTLGSKLTQILGELTAKDHVPEPLRAHVTPRDARQRWAALGRFAAEAKHLLVTNGPYQMHAWSPGGAVLRVFRDFSYPLGVGSYDAYAFPLRAFVARTERRGDRLEVQAEVERVERFAREHRIVTEPLAQRWAQKDRGILPVLRYVVVGADGVVARSDSIAPTDPGVFVVPLGDLAGRGPLTVLLSPVVRTHHASAQVRIVRID